MTHPDARALELAIAAHPADRTPRLVYADWLDEHGSPEAGDPAFAAALRDEGFDLAFRAAAERGLSLREAYGAALLVRAFTAPALAVMAACNTAGRALAAALEPLAGQVAALGRALVAAGPPELPDPPA